MENFGKTTIFPGGFGRIGEIPHGRIWPDWGHREYCAYFSTKIKIVRRSSLHNHLMNRLYKI